MNNEQSEDNAWAVNNCLMRLSMNAMKNIDLIVALGELSTIGQCP